MAIIIEAINIIIKREMVDNKCKGGFLGLLADISFMELPWHMDKELVRIGFMDPDSLNHFIPALIERGIEFNEDWCIVDMMSGPTQPCVWFGFGRQMLFKNGSNIGVSFGSYSIGWLKSKNHLGIICDENKEYYLASPKGWTFNNAITNINNVPIEDTKKLLISLGLPNGMVPFIDEFNNIVTNPKPKVFKI